MSKPKHTPGPWTIEGDGRITTPFAGDEIIIRTGGLRTVADTQLIASAPELAARIANLESLLAEKQRQCDKLTDAIEQVLIASEDNGDMDDIDWSGLRAALGERRTQ